MTSYRWLGHYGVLVEAGGSRVYVDPFLLKPKTSPPADVVLIGCARAPMLSPVDVAFVRTPATRVFGPPEVAAEIPGTEVLAPGDVVRLPGLSVAAVPAHTERTSFFPRERGGLGFVLEAEGWRLYHAGATDPLPEMEGIRADVAFLPVSGRFVMDAAEAARAADLVGAAARHPLLLSGDRFRPLPSHRCQVRF